MSLPLSATFDGSPPIVSNHDAVSHNVLSGLLAPELATTHLARGVEEGFENDDVDLSFPRKRLDEEQQSGEPNGNIMLPIGGEGQVEGLFVGYPDPDAEEEQIGGDPNVGLNASSFNPESRKRTRDATEEENGGGLGGVGLQPNILDMSNRQQQQQQQQQHTGVSPSSSNSPLENGTSKSTTTTTTTTTTTSSTTGQTKTGNGDDFFAGFAPAKLAHVSVPPFKEEAVTIDPKTIPHVVLPKNYAIIGGKHLPDALPENGSQTLPMHSLFSEMQDANGNFAPPKRKGPLVSNSTTTNTTTKNSYGKTKLEGYKPPPDAVLPKRTKTLEELARQPKKGQKNWQVCGVVVNGVPCPYGAAQKDSMRKHQSSIHNIGVEWYTCSVPLPDGSVCGYRAKQQSNLRTHKAFVHDINVKWHECTYPDIKDPTQRCQYRAKRTSHLQLHQKSIHAINVEWFPCDERDRDDPTKMCDYRAKQQSHLKLHKSSMHNVGVRWFHCQEPNCTYKAKQQSHLKQHFVRVHSEEAKQRNATTSRGKKKGSRSRGRSGGRARKHPTTSKSTPPNFAFPMGGGQPNVAEDFISQLGVAGGVEGDILENLGQGGWEDGVIPEPMAQPKTSGVTASDIAAFHGLIEPIMVPNETGRSKRNGGMRKVYTNDPLIDGWEEDWL